MYSMAHGFHSSRAFKSLFFFVALLNMYLDVAIVLSFFFFLTNSRWVSMYIIKSCQWEGGAVSSWLVRWSLDRAIRVRALAGDIVVSWARHFTLAVPLSTQVYKFNAGHNPAMDKHPIGGGGGGGGSRSTPSCFILQKPGKADFTYSTKHPTLNLPFYFHFQKKHEDGERKKKKKEKKKKKVTYK